MLAVPVFLGQAGQAQLLMFLLVSSQGSLTHGGNTHSSLLTPRTCEDEGASPQFPSRFLT